MDVKNHFDFGRVTEAWHVIRSSLGSPFLSSRLWSGVWVTAGHNRSPASGARHPKLEDLGCYLGCYEPKQNESIHSPFVLFSLSLRFFQVAYLACMYCSNLYIFVCFLLPPYTRRLNHYGDIKYYQMILVYITHYTYLVVLDYHNGIITHYQVV